MQRSRIVCFIAAGVLLFSGSTFFTEAALRPGHSALVPEGIMFSSVSTICRSHPSTLFVRSESIDSLPSDSTSNLEEDTFPKDEPYGMNDLRYKKTAAAETIVTTQDSLMMQIITYLGTPYVFGGNTLRGIDCSGFTLNVYRDALGVLLYRSANDQFRQGEHIDAQSDLQFGDLVFFNTMRRVAPGHVGIYLGDRLFVHASRSKGVIVSNLDQSYYVQRYMGARRVTDRFHEHSGIR